LQKNNDVVSEMAYFLIQDKKTKDYLARVKVQKFEMKLTNEIFETWIASECYGSYKIYSMTESQFNKGRITPVHTLTTIGKYMMSLGYYPY